MCVVINSSNSLMLVTGNALCSTTSLLLLLFSTRFPSLFRYNYIVSIHSYFLLIAFYAVIFARYFTYRLVTPVVVLILLISEERKTLHSSLRGSNMSWCICLTTTSSIKCIYLTQATSSRRVLHMLVARESRRRSLHQWDCASSTAKGMQDSRTWTPSRSIWHLCLVDQAT